MARQYYKEYIRDSDMLRKEIIQRIRNLCDDEIMSYVGLSYKARKVKNHCGYNKICYRKITDNVIPHNFRTCKNPNFSRDLDSIGLTFGDPMTFKRIRVERDVSNSGGLTHSNLLLFMPFFILGFYLLKKGGRGLVLMILMALTLFTLIKYLV